MKRGLRFLGIQAVVLLIVILGIWFVAASATNIIFNNNASVNYDEGSFFINWTNSTSSPSPIGNWTVARWMNSIYTSTTDNANTSGTNFTWGYSFSNTTEANYTFAFSSFFVNGTRGANSSNVSMYVDRTGPVINFTGYTNATAKKNTSSLTLNISVGDALSGLNGSNCFINVNGTNQTISVSNGWCNITTLSLTGLSDGNSAIKVYANDTVNMTGSNESFFVVLIDNTAPIVSISQSAVSTSTIDILISRSDASSGINSCTSNRGTVSGTTLLDTSLACGATYSYTVTCTDNAGNSASDTKSYATNGCGNSNANTVTSSLQTTQKNQSFTKITPGAVTIMKDFDSKIGIKQIQIEVNNEAQNVKITVTKYDERPAEVSVSKSGKVYQYIQIKAQNLTDKLDKATAEFKVEKSWASQNNLSREKIAISKFNETLKQWMELPTTSSGEDGTYYYYDVELHSFSYFAISEKSVANDTGTTTGTNTQPTTPEKGTNLTWLWVLIALVVAYFGWQIVKRRRR